MISAEMEGRFQMKDENYWWGMIGLTALLAAFSALSFFWGRDTANAELQRVRAELKAEIQKKADTPPPARLSAW
ncbi:MAG: hypothetical protein E6Q76_03715 [Rhizobium sp.]|nr:MAG: hypothetical protein E6Q76_03715 [Rhizobium sp.]